MNITYMRIQNYRNFKDVEMTFHEKANYLVGENAIGKSGFLRLLSRMSAGSGITEEDYADVSLPVIITMGLHLLRNHQEYFVGFPDEHKETIRIRMEKPVEEIFPHVYDDDTGEELPLNTMRRIRYISYSFVNPEDEMVSATVYRALETKLSQWGAAHLQGLTPEAQNFIRHEVRVGNLDSSYYVNIFLLSKLLSRQDRPRADNMKFISLVALRIITQIYIMSKSRAVPMESNLIVNQKGRRYLPLIVSIDEPEIHLHPYMQRSVLNYYKQLLNNEDSRFCELLKDIFGIDGLRGQLFIVTHSTDSLVDDYRNIIRLYRDRECAVWAACGAGFHFNEEIEKHLIMHFPEVKEALYSRSVLIVEGETEYGCFQLFGATLDLFFDYYGICLINARGESSISKIKKLLEYFKIPTVALYDADVKGSRKGEKNVYFTDEICFEMDLTKTLIDGGKRRELDRIINAANGDHAKATSDMIKKACRKLDINYHDYPPRLLWHANARNTQALYVYYFSWLYSNKGVILGRLIGQSLSRKEIPPAFIRVIEAAGQLAKVGMPVRGDRSLPAMQRD
ncbi:ATP-dependent endonuclease [Megasphaera cerevisiae DSM 20462]|uniref:ATP-dependent endonuclease n=1 Tax=Megasphaera cerevisiae DSM 20462 TaxID=1122219 RepID=A0A0J6WRG7_9FIRM|nr:AAA family ATPase [Megasphaera cerevisiae]KMO86035.1 ATP-dependent endonuclease [Megasphaera cerevisiae DSM 20462]OKY52695.1 ATP-dependent endonuclease [Megasphaera cerevisiae]SKA04247.1 putative ATP-dependent endonuclease of the OLD family [Megasphaera cerevisiae DSM 20462]